MRTRFDDWRQPKPYGVLGDEMRPSERITWQVMKVYRRWSVFLALQVLTILWLSFPHFFPGGQFGWNLVWSDLAIIVEMMVGIAFLNQAMRDGACIRAELKEMRAETVLLQQIADKLGIDTPEETQ